MKMSDGGKGDAPRKQQDPKAYSEGWDRIFNSKRKDSDPNKGKALKEETLEEHEND